MMGFAHVCSVDRRTADLALEAWPGCRYVAVVIWLSRRSNLRIRLIGALLGAIRLISAPPGSMLTC